MTIVVRQIPGADFAALGRGRASPFPVIGGALYAAYLLGTDWNENPLADLSGYVRTLVPSSDVQFGAEGLHATENNYLTAPFDGGDLMAASLGGTIAVLFKAEDDIASEAPIVSAIGAGAGRGIGIHATGTNTLKTYDYDGGGDPISLTLDPARDGDKWELAIVSFSRGDRYLWRRQEGEDTAQLQATPNPYFKPAGTTDFGIGYNTAFGSANGASTIGAVAFYNRALTVPEIEAVAAGITRLMADKGVTL